MCKQLSWQDAGPCPSGTHLSGCGVRVDGDLAGASSVAVHGGAHVLSCHDGADLLLRRDVLPGSRPPQGVEGEGGVAIHLRAGRELSSPAEGEICQRQRNPFQRRNCLHPSVNTSAPLQVELEVSEDAPGRDEGAGHAGQDLPAAEVPGASGLRRSRRLLDQLAVELVPQLFELLARLQDALDDGPGVGHALQVLQRAEHLECFVLERRVVPVSWS